MESNYEIGDGIFLKYSYEKYNKFIPAHTFLILIDGPFIIKKQNKICISWKVLLPCGNKAKISENYF